ncbi:cysteine hydrolase family protein [Planococcus shenhongbingii]|uniref:cysteine hydrolase family protein n=1 Tax=Planococcus shenhongbingii TaxID=3058398 RepID=UPI00261B3511|nr:cysteine hydrolase family protein [Planococcus sp. N016]WKA58444.1 cysteine hydrolase family protein [Planococcus sp. N016]
MENEKTALILVDVQKAFDDPEWGQRNNPEAEENMERILKRWREKGGFTIHIQHQSENPESLFHPAKESFAIKKSVLPVNDEPVITKKVNSAFIGTDLEQQLKANRITAVIIAGLTTPHCVSTTTRMSGNLGFNTYLVSDATAAFAMTDQNGVHYDAETVHAISLATLHEEFATVLTTEQLIERLG